MLTLTLKGRSSVYGTKPLTRATAGDPYTEQSPKTKENDVKILLCSLAYITRIRLSFCISTGERESYTKGERERERENFRKKKIIKIGQKRFYSQVNDKA